MPKTTKETSKKVTKKANPLLEEEAELETETAPEMEADTEVDTDEVDTDEEAEMDEAEDEMVDEEPVATVKVAPAPEKPVQNKIVAEMQSDIERTRLALSKERQVSFMIPLADGEKPGAVHDCWINGLHIPVPKGRMCTVPESIMQMLAETYRVQAEAGSEYRLDLNPDKRKNL